MPRRRRPLTRPLPERPTRHLPGSPGKIEVMRQRNDRGEQLYHPLDAPDHLDWGLAAWKSRNGKTHGALAEVYLKAA